VITNLENICLQYKSYFKSIVHNISGFTVVLDQINNALFVSMTPKTFKKNPLF